MSLTPSSTSSSSSSKAGPAFRRGSATSRFLSQVEGRSGGDDDKSSQEDKELTVLEFIQAVLWRRLDPGQGYADFLRDGCVIEELLRNCCPTPLGKGRGRRGSLISGSAVLEPEERVVKVIGDLFEFGVPIDLLFEPDDLLKANNIPQVTEALLEVKRLVSSGRGRGRLRSVSGSGGLDSGTGGGPVPGTSNTSSAANTASVSGSARCCTSCGEKLANVELLRAHLFKVHPEAITPKMAEVFRKVFGPN